MMRLPHAVFLDVARAFFIKVDLTQIMQQRGNGNAFLGIINAVDLTHAGACEIVAQTVVDVKTMLKKAARISAVVAGAGGGSKKIAIIRAQIVKELFCAVNARRPMYESFTDVKIDNNRSPEEAAADIRAYWEGLK